MKLQVTFATDYTEVKAPMSGFTLSFGLNNEVSDTQLFLRDWSI